MQSLRVHNEYVRTFKIAKEIDYEMGLKSYVVPLYNNVPDRRYGVPAPSTLGLIIIGDEAIMESMILSSTLNLVVLSVLVNI